MVDDAAAHKIDFANHVLHFLMTNTSRANLN
jgi:hypothetical protein